MNLEKTMIIKGALRTPAYVESTEEFKKNADSEVTYENSLNSESYTPDIDNDILISQLIRLVSLIAKTVDLTTLPQEQQDAISAQVSIFESYPMMGDQIMFTDGPSRLAGAMKLQGQYAENYAGVINTSVIADPYKGLEASTRSTLDKAARQLLIDKLVSQSLIGFNSYDQVDQEGMTAFIDNGFKYIMIGSYVDMPNGNEVYTSLNAPTSPTQDAGVMITNHMVAGSYFDVDSQTFKP